MSRAPELSAIFYRFEGTVVDDKGELLHKADSSIINSYFFSEHVGIVSVDPNFDNTQWGHRFRTWGRVDSCTVASVEDEEIGELYEGALEKAGVEGAKAMVVEAHPSGILAAKKLGCTVVGFTSPRGELTRREAWRLKVDEAIGGYSELETYVKAQMKYRRPRAHSRAHGSKI